MPESGPGRQDAAGDSGRPAGRAHQGLRARTQVGFGSLLRRCAASWLANREGSVRGGAPLDQVRTLLAVVDEAPSRPAAEVLHVTPRRSVSASRRWEQRTGGCCCCAPSRAPHRLRRGGSFGSAGTGQLERDAGPNSALDDAAGPRLAIAVNADSLATWFLPALTRSPAPRCHFDLRRDDQDHTLNCCARDGLWPPSPLPPRPYRAARYALAGCATTMAAPAFADSGCPGAPLGWCCRSPVVRLRPQGRIQDRLPARYRPAPPAQPRPTYVPSPEGFASRSPAGFGWRGHRHCIRSSPMLPDGHVPPARGDLGEVHRSCPGLARVFRHGRADGCTSPGPNRAGPRRRILRGGDVGPGAAERRPGDIGRSVLRSSLRSKTNDRRFGQQQAQTGAWTAGVRRRRAPPWFVVAHPAQGATEEPCTASGKVTLAITPRASS